MIKPSSMFRKLIIKARLSGISALLSISLATLILFSPTTNVYSVQATLSWDLNNDSGFTVGYNIHYGTSSGIYDYPTANAGNQSSYTFPSLADDITYYFVVTAFDSSGNESNPSAEVVLDNTIPSKPINLSATAISDSQIDISWNGSTDDVGVTGYNIYRDATLITTTTNTSYQGTGLNQSTTYKYIVSAYDASGNESQQSVAASATTDTVPIGGGGGGGGDTGVPVAKVNNAPVLLNLGNKSISEGKTLNFTISATDPDGDILNYTASNLPFGASFDENNATFSWTPTYDQADTYSDIIFQVSDGKDNDSGNITITVSNNITDVKTVDVVSPSTPTSLLATAISTTQINLSWNASTDDVGVSGYKIYKGSTQIAVTSNTDFKDTGLSTSETYTYTVSAYDAAGNTSSQSIGSFATTLPLSMANIYWHHMTTGQVDVWSISGASKVAEESPVTVSDLDWQIKGIGDFDGDGVPDMLWRHSITGQVLIVLMNETSIDSYGSPETVSDLDWQIKDVGDFDGDGMSDILWQHSISGQVLIVLMNGTSIASSEPLTSVSDLDWQIKDVGDFDGDGKSDMLWHHSTTGQVIVVLMNGTSIDSYDSPTTVSDLDWQIKDVGDFNGDDKSDMLWQHSTTGQVIVVLMNGTGVDSYGSSETVSDLDWQTKDVKDFDGEGKSDILWRHSTTGQVIIEFMDGASLLSIETLETVSDLNWKIQ